MSVRERLQAAADSIPLPAETLAGVVIGVLAQRFRPLPLPAWTRPVGSVLAGTGLAVVVAAWQERGPGSLEDPETLVTTGLHRVSRNPIYLGFTAAHLGLAGATRNGWMLATCPVSAALVHRWVLREEDWLRDRFGSEYDAYRGRVPRYLAQPTGWIAVTPVAANRGYITKTQSR
ncbi:methyltransferase family protein [Nocardioides speluncae]|uniref:methyltransferase family protein n=1 Tax=Nocardioides speluncae TaxID=2670337 RepID=UPI00137B79E9|nr:isoprenylcysteine carboxylmethyltransferase family protein [Nocardioides speluncae]